MNASVRKALPYILLLALALLLLVVRKCKNTSQPPTKQETTVRDKRDPAANGNRDVGFDRRISYLQYSRHAKCRMDCRHITQAEVESIMRDGKINYTKSDLQNSRCPRYAVEGVTDDKQDVRIVFAQCNESTTVVTVIDLDTEWSCDCPGDDKKFENRN